MNNTMSDKLRTQLPQQKTIEEFLEQLHFPSNPQTSYHLSELVSATQEFFNLPDAVAELKLSEYGFNGHGNTGTFLETLVIWGTFQLFEDGKVKKVGPNQWAHISCDLPAYSLPPVSRKEVSQAMVSVKMLRDLQHTPQQIKGELTHLWSLPVISLAIRRVFQPA